MPGLFGFPMFDDDHNDSHSKASREGQKEASNEGFWGAQKHELTDIVRCAIPIPESEEERIKDRAYHHQQRVDSGNRSFLGGNSQKKESSSGDRGTDAEQDSGGDYSYSVPSSSSLKYGSDDSRKGIWIWIFIVLFASFLIIHGIRHEKSTPNEIPRTSQSPSPSPIRPRFTFEDQEEPQAEVSAASFPVVVDYDGTVEDLVEAGKYNWLALDWMNEVGVKNNPHPSDRHGVAKVRIVLVCFNREVRSEEALSELGKMNLRPAETIELLAFGAAYPQEQVKFPIVALGSTYGSQGWAPSLEDENLPVYGMVGRGLSMGGNRNGGDMWESNSRFAAVRK